MPTLPQRYKDFTPERLREIIRLLESQLTALEERQEVVGNALNTLKIQLQKQGHDSQYIAAHQEVSDAVAEAGRVEAARAQVEQDYNFARRELQSRRNCDW